MKILVPIKRVVDPYAKVKPLSDGSGIDTAGVKFEINPFDEIAIEEAVRMRESGTPVTLIAITIGPAEAQEQLRKALAMGADEAILVESSADWDAPSVAVELSQWVAQIQPDLILMGKQSTDDDSNQVAQMLSAKLDWPLASYAAAVKVDGGNAVVTRETDNGEEQVEFSLPAIISTDLRLNEPRYIALPAIIKARSKPLNTEAPKSSPNVRTKVLGIKTPPSRSAGKIVSTVDELVSALKEKGAL